MEVNGKFFNHFLFNETGQSFFEAISNEATRHCFHSDMRFEHFCVLRECYVMGGEL